MTATPTLLKCNGLENEERLESPSNLKVGFDGSGVTEVALETFLEWTPPTVKTSGMGGADVEPTRNDAGIPCTVSWLYTELVVDLW